MATAGLADRGRTEQSDDIRTRHSCGVSCPSDDRRAEWADMKVSGARVLLTGATGGIGHALARALHGGGAQLLLTGRRLDVLKPLADELGARAIAADLSVRDDVERLAVEAADVDILIANAALPASGHLLDLSSGSDRHDARGQPARADRARTRPGPGHGAARPRAHRVHLLALGQGGLTGRERVQRSQVRPARFCTRRPCRFAQRRCGRLRDPAGLRPRRRHVRRLRA